MADGKFSNLSQAARRPSARMKWLLRFLLLAFLVGYFLGFSLLYRWLGDLARVFTLPAILIWAWVGGLRGGLLASVTILVVNLITHWLHGIPWTNGPVTFIASLMLAALIGRMSDLDDRQQAQLKTLDAERREAEKLREKYRLLLEQSPLSIMSFDAEGVVDFVNQWHMEHFAGGEIGAESFLWRPIYELPGVARAGIGDELKKVLGGESVILEGVLFPRRPGIEETYVNIKAVPLLRNGTVVGGLLLWEDATSVIRARMELEEAKRGLEERVAERTRQLEEVNANLLEEAAERDRVEEDLRRSEDRFRTAFINAPTGLALVDTDRRLFMVNPEFRRMLGYAESEMIGRSFNQFTHPEDRAAGRERFARLLAGEDAVNQARKRYIHKDGRTIWVLVNNSLIRDSKGQPLYFLSHIMDITDQKAAEESLLSRAREMEVLHDFTHEVAAHLFMDTLVDSIIDQVIRAVGCDLALFFLKEGDRLVLKRGTQHRPEMAGFPASEHQVGECLCGLAARDARAVYAKDVAGDDRCTCQGCREAGFTSFAALPLAAGGEVKALLGMASRDSRDFSAEASFLETMASEAAMILQNVMLYEEVRRHAAELDLRITELEKAQAALREEKDRFKVLVSESPLGVSIIGRDGRYRYINPRFEELFGYRLADVPNGREWFIRAFPDPDDRREALAAWKLDLAKGQPGRTRPRVYNVTCRNGDTKVVQFWPVTLPTGEEFILYEDITEQTEAEKGLRRMEQQLHQAQKMEAVGTLASGIAHDFNNILQGMAGYVSMFRKVVPAGSDSEDHVQRLDLLIRRAVDLVNRLLTFGRKVEVMKKPIDLADEIRQTVPILERTLPKMIDIELDLPMEPLVIMADSGQLEQVLLNLGSNARDAMPDGGRLIIAAREVILDEDFCRSRPELNPGPHVVVTVADTGHGMPPEIVEHLFEPFFTTKELGRGTGLGLSTAYGIMRSHEGRLECTSEPDRGTTFTMYFAARPEEGLEEKTGLGPKDVILGGTETVLLVDDEEGIRETARAIMKEYGYRVMTADSGEACIQMYRDRQKEIDLVVVDLGMPGIGGAACIRTLREINPDVKIIICSGYPSGDPMVREQIALGVSYLKKPYKLSALPKTVRETLDRPAG